MLALIYCYGLKYVSNCHSLVLSADRMLLAINFWTCSNFFHWNWSTIEWDRAKTKYDEWSKSQFGQLMIWGHDDVSLGRLNNDARLSQKSGGLRFFGMTVHHAVHYDVMPDLLILTNLQIGQMAILLKIVREQKMPGIFSFPDMSISCDESFSLLRKIQNRFLNTSLQICN